jgi:hypothetical protein
VLGPWLGLGLWFRLLLVLDLGLWLGLWLIRIIISVRPRSMVKFRDGVRVRV